MTTEEMIKELIENMCLTIAKQREIIEELIDKAEYLCDDIRDMPCGCECCSLWNLEECEEDKENYKCPFKKIVDKYKAQ